MRSCENCGARVPAGATSCPACGVFAGEYVEGERAVPPKKPRYAMWVSFLVAAIVAAGVSIFLTRPHPTEPPSRTKTKTAPVRVVKDRPGGAYRAKGATINEAEAVLVLRRSFTEIKPECVGILSNGFRGGAYTFTVVNGCDHTRLGKWRVDGKTKAVSRAV